MEGRRTSSSGCLMASAALTSFSFSTGQSRKAPPEAVRIMRRRPPSGSPWMHWKMACACASVPFNSHYEL